MIRLHYYPSNASFTPHVLLRELGVPFELQLVDRMHAAHKSAEYLRLNPNGLIPVLVDDREGNELVLYETAAICLHLCDSHPGHSLAPPLGTPQRAHFYKWLVWLTNTLQATLIHYFYPERMVDDGDAAAASQVRAHAQARVGQLLEQIDAHLALQHGPWFFGDPYTAVDPFAFMLCRWTRGFSSRPAREYAHIGPFLSRVLARPAVQAALAAEGIVEPFY